jgi:AcrR family transcriptional regulator
VSPRQYSLGRRAEAAQQTRARIVDATVALHSEQGIVATSYADIARRADVAIGTVYHHFPVLDDLVMACGARLMELTRPPAPAVFAGLRSRRDRIGTLVQQIFGWYERSPGWRRAVCDADKLEVLARGVQRREAVLHELIAAGLGAQPDAAQVTTARAFLDYEVYRNLADTGLSTTEAATTVTNVLLSGL